MQQQNSMVLSTQIPYMKLSLDLLYSFELQSWRTSLSSCPLELISLLAGSSTAPFEIQFCCRDMFYLVYPKYLSKTACQ
ncbi:hypothetical protein I7I50_10286 [Histoplasma capsulatum G186AR]|uniref:Uncharacterized protein n=1 Tax=Ajellomyces capsulatus TaxID=5037 RepID=A0A8H7Z9I6_AJECA|nr:hypothetical protein I7I52_01525 [Histoplasma capsulatum]QSS69106.1 hypothetical protein I7I50_10286 [Histoplasma capsulatum G186AR]